MFWRVSCEGKRDGLDFERPDGRFVLERRSDSGGARMDLWLECDGRVAGWRIDGDSLDETPWATRRLPRAASMFDEMSLSDSADSGVYSWLEFGPDCRSVALHGRCGDRVIRMERESGVSVGALRSVWDAIRESGIRPEDGGKLLLDGVRARNRAVERLCGLGRELDGPAFDDGVWRRSLAGLDLEEIHGQLRAFEVRFDRKYPPSPVSRPERLSEGEDGGPGDVRRALNAMDIVRG